MLKLLKYEIKQTWKMCATFQVIILLGCLGLIFNPFNKFFMASFFYTTLLSLVVVGISIALFVYCIGSFDQEFTQPQGYLTMTLPIKTRDFIGAKFINHLFWYLIWIHIMMFSGYYATKIYGTINLVELYIGNIAVSNLFKLYINGISSYILGILIGYFSIVIFSTQTRNNSQTLKKVILFIGLSYIVGTLINILSFMIPYAMEYGIPNQVGNMVHLRNYIQTNAYSLGPINTVMKLFAACLFYIGTKQIIEKRVQL